MYNPQLNTFICSADLGSFSKAAEKMFITPTAVIKQINLLESEIGFQLFVRTHRGLILTEAGKSFYNDAKFIIQYSEESINRAKNAITKNSNIIRIGTSPMTQAQFLLKLKIHKHSPESKIQLIPFENTPENAREILKNLGKNIDVVAGVFDNDFSKSRGCAALELYKAPIRCAVSIHHSLASQENITIENLYNQNLMIIQKGWNSYIDQLRDDILQFHQQIKLVDFSFYNITVFNQCENSSDILLTIDEWANVHPLLKVLPVEWDYTIPFGLLHAPKPSQTVKQFLCAVEKANKL